VVMWIEKDVLTFYLYKQFNETTWLHNTTLTHNRFCGRFWTRTCQAFRFKLILRKPVQ